MLMLSKQPIVFLVLGSICSLVLGPGRAGGSRNANPHGQGTGIQFRRRCVYYARERRFRGPAAGWNSPSDCASPMTGLAMDRSGPLKSRPAPQRCWAMGRSLSVSFR